MKKYSVGRHEPGTCLKLSTIVNCAVQFCMLRVYKYYSYRVLEATHSQYIVSFIAVNAMMLLPTSTIVLRSDAGPNCRCSSSSAMVLLLSCMALFPPSFSLRTRSTSLATLTTITTPSLQALVCYYFLICVFTTTACYCYCFLYCCCSFCCYYNYNGNDDDYSCLCDLFLSGLVP